ncbi:MAG: phage tail assembly chaperone [Methylophilaceae bacterium]
MTYSNQGGAEPCYERNLLKECDYLIVEDYPHKDGNKEEWKAYRQLLRDLPSVWVGIS